MLLCTRINLSFLQLACSYSTSACCGISFTPYRRMHPNDIPDKNYVDGDKNYVDSDKNYVDGDKKYVNGYKNH